MKLQQKCLNIQLIFLQASQFESASYIENNNQINNEFDTEEKENNETEYTPKLFSGEQSYQTEEDLQENDYKTDNTEQLFDQDTNEEKILKFLHF